MSIDRSALLARHDPRLTGADDAVLSVGNGHLAISVDRTGTQTLPADLDADRRLNTLAEWGWEGLPGGDGSRWEDHLRSYDTPRGPARYMDLDGPSEVGADEGTTRTWRANPHKVSLLRPVLVTAATGEPVRAEDLSALQQHLDLHRSVITSRFRHRGIEVTVRTAVDPEGDVLAITLDAPHLALELRFPGDSEDWDRAADWDAEDHHRTALAGSVIHREVGDLAYTVTVTGARPLPTGRHRVRLEADGPGALGVALALAPVRSPHLAVTLRGRVPIAEGRSAEEVLDRSARWWEDWWARTGALDLSGTDDPRATELERRVVLSRHLQRVHAAGVMPPAETGLLMNSWRGRAHLEMHPWHTAHAALWGDADSVRRSLGFYTACLPTARATAAAQRCRGARWPKQIGPDLRESPSDIGPFLLWQQSHPILLAELCRRADPALVADDAVAEVVEESGRFLADVLRRDPDGGLGVGPPLVGAQERHVADRSRLQDASFELASAAWGLRVADAWRERRGTREAGEWTALARRVHPPLTADGRLRTFRRGPAMTRSDHPSHLLAAGFLPPGPALTPEVVGEALVDAVADWDWESTWGWDCPAAAMTAARLGRAEQAVDLLLRDTPKNRMDAAGHCYQRPSLPLYLPANGATLLATALMAAGWDGGPAQPGLPAAWDAQVEGILPSPGPWR